MSMQKSERLSVRVSPLLVIAALCPRVHMCNAYPFCNAQCLYRKNRPSWHCHQLFGLPAGTRLSLWMLRKTYNRATIRRYSPSFSGRFHHLCRSLFITKVEISSYSGTLHNCGNLRVPYLQPLAVWKNRQSYGELSSLLMSREGRDATGCWSELLIILNRGWADEGGFDAGCEFSILKTGSALLLSDRGWTE
jgi:hypothetical protein